MCTHIAATQVLVRQPSFNFFLGKIYFEDSACECNAVNRVLLAVYFPVLQVGCRPLEFK